MKFQDAIDVFDDKKRLDEIPPTTIGEDIMLLAGACLDGKDIICLTCGFLNECCSCAAFVE